MWKLVLHTDSQMSVCYASIGTYKAVFGWKPMNCKKLEMNFRTLVSHSCMTRQNAELTSTLKCYGIFVSGLKCESKFRLAEEDSGEAEFTPAQKPNEAATSRCKENPQALRLYQPTQG